MELTLDEALKKGVEAHQAGQFQEAERLYCSALKAQPNHPDANHNMGVLAVGLDKIQEALAYFKIALEANPSIGQFWISYIGVLIKLGRLSDAQSVLKQAKDIGANGEAFDQLEQQLLGQELQTKETNTTEVEGSNSPKPNILDTTKLDKALRLAKRKLKDGQLEEAKSIYEDILQKFPKHKQALIALQSLTQGVTVITQDPPSDQLQPIINLYTQGQLQQALSHATEMLERFPSSVLLHNIAGAANAGLMQFDAAIGSYKNALRIKPDYAETYNNMGNALKGKGDLEAAIESYKQALKVKPDDSEAYYNMGITLNSKGDLEAAIESYKQALKIKPDNAETYNNMGVALTNSGNPEAAIESYTQALKIKPDYAEACNNMGNSLKENGRLEAAIESYTQALKIKPDYAEACNNMGNALKENGRLEAAIESYTQAIKIKPDYAEAYNNMGSALQLVAFNKPNPDMQKIVISILDRKNDISPRSISEAAISLLKFEPVIKELFEKYSSGEINQSIVRLTSNLSEVPLLFKLMSVCPLADLELEAVLTDIRSSLLLSVSEISNSPEVLHFQSALALQCFTNEYIYNQSDQESKALAVLEGTVEQTLLKGDQPRPQLVLCLATYRALHQYKWCDLLILNASLEEVFTRQILEPKQEIRLKSDMPALQDIKDEVSSKVREQYEANPYPRWVNLQLYANPYPTSEAVKKINLKLFDKAIYNVDVLNILIAGCGTGQHSIGTASRFGYSKVLAIDLSMSSLAYAKRKTEELGLKNIDYMQADILVLGNLDRKFDIIESVGVLHHMDDPMAGWRILVDCLKSGGLMKIGLYSELARQSIVRVREEISQSRIGSSDLAIKSFRSDLINSSEEHHKSIRSFNDIYSLSELRDLLFHVQEHRFTIPQIQKCLDQLGLKFCGFEAGIIVQDFKLTNTGADDPYDLDKWTSYEEANPHSFAGMYQFWCQKVD